MLNFYGVVIQAMSANQALVNTLPYNTLVPTQPLQVELINYLYYSGNTLLTSTTGLTNTSDYSRANKISATLLLVFEGFTSESEISAVANYISSPVFTSTLQSYVRGYYLVRFFVE